MNLVSVSSALLSSNYFGRLPKVMDLRFRREDEDEREVERELSAGRRRLGSSRQLPANIANGFRFSSPSLPVP